RPVSRRWGHCALTVLCSQRRDICGCAAGDGPQGPVWATGLQGLNYSDVSQSLCTFCPTCLVKSMAVSQYSGCLSLCLLSFFCQEQKFLRVRAALFVLSAFGEDLTLNLIPDTSFLSPYFSTDPANSTHSEGHLRSCFYSGNVDGDQSSVVAVSLCSGIYVWQPRFCIIHSTLIHMGTIEI
uniref:Peptidase M12B propeptide domain-containing protein n=1 Tax=Periophthalmus magnuspinnatus TaxID=409849 RepID=A0A3B4A5S5_9GOBI